MTSTSSRVAIVTGGSRGIGRAVAERLGAEGFAVVVNYAGNKTEAGAAVEVIESKGARAIAVQETFGGVDVVVHAAGIMALGMVADMDLDVFDRQVRTNLRGTFVVDQQAARRVRCGGAIINFSSSVLALQAPTYAGYAATKGGVEAMTLILARELRGRDITVNAVAPGPTATALFLDGKDEETIQRLASQAPLERLGTPSDIAEVVAFLAGAARWINGQVLRANGGIV
jgi:3-oxoacyl-[acyl-carrier protein] reductase